MRACKILQEDLDFLVQIARGDLRLQVSHRESRWRSWFGRGHTGERRASPNEHIQQTAPGNTERPS